MDSIQVLYDGWPLVRDANSPAARHLLTVLAHLPGSVRALLALPEESPNWLPSRADTLVHTMGKNTADRMRWEQRIIPHLAQKTGVHLVHSTSSYAPLFSSTAAVCSPAGYGDTENPQTGMGSRLRIALGKGGMSRSSGVLFPNDLPVPKGGGKVHILPPTVHPDFTPISFGEQQAPAIPGVEMPETYTIYHGPDHESALRTLLQAWTWAAGPIGEYYPLLLMGFSSGGKKRAQALLNELKVGGSVRLLPDIPAQHLVGIYQNCSALFHPAVLSPWGDAVRHALACGIPVVAWEAADSDAVAGPAAYLVAKRDLRAFGAAMISVVVKDSLAEQLREQAVKRSKAWRGDGFGTRLEEIYREMCE